MRYPVTISLRFALSVGRPTTSSAPYWDAPVVSVTLTSLLMPCARVKEGLLIATSCRIVRRFGLTWPDEDCVHGRAATSTASALADRFSTFTRFAAPGAA